MINVLISGASGRMGRVIAEICANDPEAHVVAGFDIVLPNAFTFPIYSDFADFTGTADALIDFSSPDAIDRGLLKLCVSGKIPIVLCTTGHSAAQLAEIEAAAKSVPVYKSAKMSVGINMLTDLIREAAARLGSAYDVEIVESHHRRKLDAPSGTALMLADSVKAGLDGSYTLTFDRSGRREPRRDDEIGISAVRGGTIPGEHSVIFAGRDEVIEFRHTIYSREAFGEGAVRAAKFIAGVKTPGLYSHM
jgi:4-hydroxy-tetrahydrodipicolinate reductase